MASALSIIGCTLVCPFLCVTGCIAIELCKKYWNSLSPGCTPIEAAEQLLSPRYFIDSAEEDV